MNKFVSLKRDHDDAIAHLNLLYRLRADTELSLEAREADISNVL